MKTLALGILALTGCMRIYPDPELPDIKLEWNTGNCPVGNETRFSLVDLDDGNVTRFSAPCPEYQLTLEDVDRKLFRVDGAQVQSDGSIVATASAEADLRNGFNEQAFLFFEEDPSLRITWDFDMAATCESLELDTIAVDFEYPEDDYGYTSETSCELGVFAGYSYGQTFTLQLRGISRRKTIVASPRTPTIDLTPFEEEVTDIGPLTLTPCGDDCPSGPQPF